MRSNLNDKIKHWSLVYLVNIPPFGVQSHAVTLMVGVVYKGRGFVLHIWPVPRRRACAKAFSLSLQVHDL